MALRHSELTDAGARPVGIAVDSVGQQAAMVEKLRLPFPLLSDPGGEQAIKPYDLWNEQERGGIAHPAIVIVDPQGTVAFRSVSGDFADRMTEDEVVQAVRSLGLESTTQDPPQVGEPDPGPQAMPVRAMGPYFRGVRFASIALGMRHPEIRDDSKRLSDEAARYVESTGTLKS